MLLFSLRRSPLPLSQGPILAAPQDALWGVTIGRLEVRGGSHGANRDAAVVRVGIRSSPPVPPVPVLTRQLRSGDQRPTLPLPHVARGGAVVVRVTHSHPHCLLPAGSHGGRRPTKVGHDVVKVHLRCKRGELAATRAGVVGGGPRVRRGTLGAVARQRPGRVHVPKGAAHRGETWRPRRRAGSCGRCSVSPGDRW